MISTNENKENMIFITNDFPSKQSKPIAKTISGQDNFRLIKTPKNSFTLLPHPIARSNFKLLLLKFKLSITHQK